VPDLQRIPLKVFLLGLLWTLCYGALPVVVMVWKWVELWQDWPDWRVIGPAVYTSVGLGVFAYWRKYQALLQLPPDIEWARQLAGDVKRETTVQTVEKQMDPPAIVTTTVKETEIVKQDAPQSGEPAK
jgi:hypothetical protein